MAKNILVTGFEPFGGRGENPSLQVLARLKPRPAAAGRFARPGPKPATGLSPALGAWIEHRPGEVRANGAHPAGG